MKKRLSARELELRAASSPFAGRQPAGGGSGEVAAMLVRRGLQPDRNIGNCPFVGQLDAGRAEEFSEWMNHYAFRLFLRGAIRRWQGFRPEDTTRYLTREQAQEYARVLVSLGLAEEIPPGRFRLQPPAGSFGPILEWYVGRELKKRYGFNVETGVKLHVRGGGGDLDIVAAAEGKLVYLELKSSPPKNLSTGEVFAFWGRLALLRPDLALFVVDTALRLSDKVLPMLIDTFRQRGFGELAPKRIAAQFWTLKPHVYVVNGSRDLMANIGKAISAGFLAMSPPIAGQ